MRIAHRNHEVDIGHINVILRPVCVSFIVVEKQQLLYFERVSVALVLRHAKRVRHVIVVCRPSGVTMFFHLSHKRQGFQKKSYQT